MLKERRLITTLLIAVLIGALVVLAGCTKEEDDSEFVPDTYGGAMTATLALPSDSENESTWTFEQDPVLFTCEEAFVDNGTSESSTESQSFLLVPETAGTTTIIFTNQTEDTTYTYECEISEDFSQITVNKSEGMQAGAAIEAPELALERN